MPRNADCFQLGELCSEQRVRPWVNPNAGDVIIKLWTWKLRGNSIGLTNQGSIRIHRFLEFKSQVSRLLKAVPGIGQKLCFVEVRAPTVLRKRMAANMEHRVGRAARGLASPVWWLFGITGWAAASTKAGWKVRMKRTYPRGFCFPWCRGTAEKWSGPDQPGLPGKPFIDPAACWWLSLSRFPTLACCLPAVGWLVPGSSVLS